MTKDLTNKITVLNLDPVAADHASLADILRRSEYTLASSTSVEDALKLLRQSRIAVLFCESDRSLGPWQETLELVMALPDPPYLVVTSRLADDRLWAEALNLGAYDVLAKPFDRTEVTRIVGSASLRWASRNRRADMVRASVA